MRWPTGLLRVPCVLLLLLGVGTRAQEPAPTLTHGPLRGHIDTHTIHVWARATADGTYTLHLQSLVDAEATTCTATATPAADHTLQFVATALTAGTAYDFWITRGELVVYARGGAPLVTAMPDEASEAVIAFGSCANDLLFREQPIWGRILARSPQALVLLGDTPYIDDGTVEGRRRRHRAFFEFPPIRAVLSALPTWTIWDDHDYATNDQFGAVKGSETARGVFLEYHAHASYGDGTRGIYTSFRRGPIEVFLLDTRSFADTETSVLAPGERSLLGKAQTEWLQQGLLASTAPFKVLACGMVWNGGVRPEKKDCWGNWTFELQGLHGWMRVHRIEGVVLVSGDVHRSRVILHRPFADLTVPEFVTSPLAQNVIEANAAPVPGLVFDAGEPSSCLFLLATRGRREGGGVLRAVFQAGDGREFHVHEVTEESLCRTNAAVDYRQVVAIMRVTFGEALGGVPTVEWMPGTPLPQPESACGAAWRAAVASARPAFAQLARTQQSDRCRFRAAADGEPGSEYVGELSLGLATMQNLVVANCLQALADGDRAAVMHCITALLTLARHLQQEPHPFAWRQAADAERQVVALHARFGKLSDGSLAIDVRECVRAHLAVRADAALGWQTMRREALAWCEYTIERIQLGEDRKASAARTRRVEVREQFLRWVNPRFDAGALLLTGVTDVPVHRQPAIAALEENLRRQDIPLAELDAKGAAGPATAAALGASLAAQLWDLHAEFPGGQVETLAALRAVAR